MAKTVLTELKKRKGKTRAIFFLNYEVQLSYLHVDFQL